MKAVLTPRDFDQLMACPKCDALHRDVALPDGSRAYCRRCHAMLAAPKAGAIARVSALALTAAILIVAALWFPFLELDAKGIGNRASVLDAVLTFSTGIMLPLSIAVAALIVVIPMLRALAILYTLTPLMLDRAPWPQAARAFRLAEALRPWSMAEIFILGVAVALVKVAGLANISPGPAFWAFGALVLVSVLQDTSMCRHTIWTRIGAAP